MLQNRQVTIVTIHNYQKVYNMEGNVHRRRLVKKGQTCRPLRKFLQQIGLHKTGPSCSKIQGTSSFPLTLSDLNSDLNLRIK